MLKYLYLKGISPQNKNVYKLILKGFNTYRSLCLTEKLIRLVANICRVDDNKASYKTRPTFNLNHESHDNSGKYSN